MDVGGPYLHISHRALGEGNHREAQTSLCRGPAPQVLSPASQMVVLFVWLVVSFFLLTGCDVTCRPKCLPGVQGRTAYLRLVTMLYLGSIYIQWEKATLKPRLTVTYLFQILYPLQFKIFLFILLAAADFFGWQDSCTTSENKADQTHIIMHIHVRKQTCYSCCRLNPHLIRCGLRIPAVTDSLKGCWTSLL